MSFDLPASGPDRDKTILTAIGSGQAQITWATVTSDHNGHHAEFQVFADALKLEGVRVGMTATVEQQIADLLDCSLLTAKLADLVWMQRTATVQPYPSGNPPAMRTVDAMVHHSEKIDAALAALGNPQGLICTVGKHWILDNWTHDRPTRAVNYGWHFEGPGFDGQHWEVTASGLRDAEGNPMRLIQGRGGDHDFAWDDYSQTCVLVSNTCTVDGQQMRFTDVVTSADLWPLAVHDGVLKITREPVPLLDDNPY